MVKKILALVFCMLMMLGIAGPALAENPNKVPVAVVLHEAAVDYSTVDLWTTEGGIRHLEYLHTWGPLDIYVDGVLTYEAVPFDDIISGNYNTKTLVGHYIFNEVWILPGGTLEGTAHATSYGGDLTSHQEFVAKIVLHGTGAYEGQTIIMSYDWISGVNHPVYEGYWLA